MLERIPAEARAELHGAAFHGRGGAGAPRLGGGAGDERAQVGADQGGGHQAEEGERGVAPADVGRVEEGAAVAALPGERGERGAGIGDGDEGAAGGVPAGGAHPLEEVLLERGDLDGAARLRGHDEQRARRVVRGGGRAHRGGRGVVEHGELEAAGSDAEGGAHDLGGEAGAAHAEQHGVGEALDRDLLRERL